MASNRPAELPPFRRGSMADKAASKRPGIGQPKKEDVSGEVNGLPADTQRDDKNLFASSAIIPLFDAPFMGGRSSNRPTISSPGKSPQPQRDILSVSVTNPFLFSVGLRSSHWGLRKEFDSHTKTPQYTVYGRSSISR
ncbi:hypothetical protein AVEN_95865-1 [Araneus ventricosus]|uniref:Uncharacterized protein n=1 Tax=Araneus ventricosus TaxID=182803 RepID=A0A4Y2X9C8_ARAVE|nr:hypothetical protein AVEN_95865-1 [Araneus ventricosus]